MTEKEVTKPLHSNNNFLSQMEGRKAYLILVCIICLLPSLLNFIGIDFSSTSYTVNIDQLANTSTNTDQFFYALNGALHHAILEWTAVTVAVVTMVVAYSHYRVHQDIAIPIMGMALFCAGAVDAFHTLAATRLIEANAPNVDFIPFTWALSRIFNASIMICGTLLCLWLYKRNKSIKNSAPNDKSKEKKLLLITGVVFISVAYLCVQVAALSDNLPSTMYHQSLISRPYDIFPLGLFILAATLFWTLYRVAPSVAKFGLLLSVIPEITTQLHMAFGSSNLFDNHFNIAHSLKIVAYGCVFLGIIFDLKLTSSDKKGVLPLDKSIRENLGLSPDKLIKVGHAKHSLSIQIPIAAFVLSISIALLVSLLFYGESKRLLTEQHSKSVAIETKRIVPIVEQAYRQAQSDVLFLSNTPPIQGLLNAKKNNDSVDYALWKKRLEKIFVEFLNTKPAYYQIRYIGVDNNWLELVNVNNTTGNKPVVIPISKLQQKAGSSYLHNTANKNLGGVYFSDVSLNREFGEIEVPYRPVIRAATPIYDTETGTIFGAVIININFSYISKQLQDAIHSNMQIFITKANGEYLHHPDKQKTFGLELNHKSQIQNDFPQLTPLLMSNDSSQSFADINFSQKSYLGIFQKLLLEKFDSKNALSLLVLSDNHEYQQALSVLQSRSLLLGGALAFIALGFAIIASRQIAGPLVDFISTLEDYDKTNSLSGLPTKLSNEIGVLARNFHNLFAQNKHALAQQTLMTQEAKQAVERLNSVFEAVADAFITMSEKGEILSFNRAAESIFGYEQQEVIGKNINLLMPSKIAAQHDGYIKNYLNTGRAGIIGVGRELMALKKNGNQFPIHLTISQIDSIEGKLFTGIVRDISKEKALEALRIENEQALKEVNERATLATDSAGIGIWEYDITNQTLTWDDWMFTLYGKSKEEFQHQFSDWQQSVHPSDLAATEQLVHQAIAEHKPFKAEFRIIQPCGAIKHLKSAATVDYDEHGDAIKLVGVNYDITEIKEAEIAHMQAKILAENTARHKSEFLASMSHEIRTPMNGVLGMLGLLMRSNLNEDQQHRVKLANSSAVSLLSLINDILDFSKVEAGKLDLEILDFNLVSLLGEFAETYGLKGQEKGLEVILDVSSINCSHVKGDPGRLRQILNNLVSNAIKFTQNGEIVIKAEVKTLAENKLQFQCHVSDTGIGIPKSKLKDIFESFTQVDASTTRQYGGTGLGLAISKQLCKLMNGDIKVESQEGKGSCFSFDIVLESSQRSTTVIPSVNIKDVELLVVDDNTTNRLVLKEQFELWGAKVTEAENGIAALAILEKKVRPDFKVAFLDMQMPYMDGAELGSRIRENPQLDNLKLVMMTSMATRGDANYFAKLGFNAYFPKPTTTSDLFDTLALTLSDSELLEQAQPLITHHYLKGLSNENNVEDVINNAQPPTGFTETRILLVEDNRVNQEVASHILAELDLYCDIAADGREALESLKLVANDSPYNIILMDCQMPEMDGYQATKAIRQGLAGEVYKDIPIIALTANAMKGDRERCIEAGMNDYISKPIEPNLLKEKLLNFYQKSPRDLSYPVDTPTGQSISASLSSQISTNPSPDKPIGAIDIWDQEALLVRVNHNKTMVQKLIQLFIDEMPGLLTELSHGLQEADKRVMRHIIHKIKGMAANISAQQLHALTYEVELYIEEEQLDKIDSDQLESYYLALKSELAKAYPVEAES